MSQNRKGQDDLMAYRDQSGGNPNMSNNKNNFSQEAARQYDHNRLRQQANSVNTNTSSKALEEALLSAAERKRISNAANVNITDHVSNMNYSNNQKLEEERRKYSSNSYENVKTRLGKITGSKAWIIPSIMAGSSRHIFNKPGVIEEQLRADARKQQEHLQELRKQAAENKQKILRNVAEEKRLRLIDQRKLEAQAATAKGSDSDFNRKLASSQATSPEKYFTSQEIQKMSDQELLRHSYAAGKLPHRSAGGLLRDTQQEKLLKDQAIQQTSHISPDRRDEVMSRIAEHKGGHERYLSPSQVSSMSKDRLQQEAISQGLTSKGLFSPIASAMYNPLAGALLAGGVRSFTQAQSTSKHLALDKHRKQLGGIGKVQQVGNITMGTGRMAHSVAMMGALGSMIPGIGSTIAPDGAAPIRSPLGHVMKAGSSLLAPTLGGPLGMLLPALAVMLPSLIGNIGVNRKLKRILGKPPSEKELTRASIADQMEPFLKRLIADGQIDGSQQLMIRHLSAIETHTSVLHEMGRIAMEKDDTEKKATERNKEILDPKPEKQSWLTKIEHLMSLTHAKYNPMYQLFMTLFGRKSPKQVIDDLKSSKETSEKKENARSLGIRLTEHILLSMPAFRIASRGYTWQDKMLLLASSTYDVLALTARETITIRRHGYGIRENAFKDKTIKKKGVDFSKVSDAMMGFLNKIPIVSAGANIVRDIFKLPSMMRGGASKVYNTAADLFFGKEFRRLQDRKELDKALGRDKSTNQLADEYISNGLPSVMESIRSYTAKQYEALLNIYDMARSQFQLLSGVHTGKVPNIQFQRYLTEEIKDAKGNITFKDHTEKRIWDKIDARRYTKDAAKQATTRQAGEAQDLQANAWSRGLHGILTKSLLPGKLGQNTLAEQMTKKLQKFNTVDDYIQKYLFGQDVDHDRHIRPFMVGDKELEKEEKRTFFKSAKSFLTDRPARTAMIDDKSSKSESADEQRKQLFVRLIGSLGPLAGLALAGPAGLPLIAGLLGGGAAGAGLTGFAKHRQDVKLDKFEWSNLNAVKDIETRFTEMQHQGIGASSLLSPNLFDSSDIKNPQQQNIIFLQEIHEELIILNDWQSDIFDELEKSNIKQDNIYTEIQRFSSDNIQILRMIRGSIINYNSQVITRFDLLIAQSEITNEYLELITTLISQPVPVAIIENRMHPDDYINVGILETALTNANPLLIRDMAADDHGRIRVRAASKGGWLDKYQSSAVLVGEGTTGKITDTAEILLKYPDGNVRIVSTKETQELLKNLKVTTIEEWNEIPQETLFTLVGEKSLSHWYDKDYSKNKWYKSGLANALDKLPEFKNYSPYTKLGYAGIFSKIDDLLDASKNRLRKSDTRITRYTGTKEEVEKYTKEDKIKEFLEMIQKNEDKNVSEYADNIKNIKDLLENDKVLNEDTRNLTKEMVESLESAAQINEKIYEVFEDTENEKKLSAIEKNLARQEKEKKEKFQEETQKGILDVLNRMYKHSKKKVTDIFSKDKKSIFDYIVTKILPKILLALTGVAAFSSLFKIDKVREFMTHAANAFMESPNLGMIGLVSIGAFTGAKFLGLPGLILGGLLGAGLSLFAPSLSDKSDTEKQAFKDNFYKKLEENKNLLFTTTAGLAASFAFWGGSKFGIPGFLIGGILGAGLGLFGIDYLFSEDKKKQDDFRSEVWDKISNLLTPTNLLIAGGGLGIYSLMSTMKGKLGLGALPVIAMLGGFAALIAPLFMDMSDDDRHTLYYNIAKKLEEHKALKAVIGAGAGLSLGLSVGNPITGLIGAIIGGAIGAGASNIAKAFGDAEKEDGKIDWGNLMLRVIGNSPKTSAIVGAVLGAKFGATIGGPFAVKAGLIGLVLGGILGLTGSTISQSIVHMGSSTEEKMKYALRYNRGATYDIAKSQSDGDEEKAKIRLAEILASGYVGMKHKDEILNIINTGDNWERIKRGEEPKTQYIGGLLDIYDEIPTLVGEGNGPHISDTAEIKVGKVLYGTKQSQKTLNKFGIKTIEDWRKLSLSDQHKLKDYLKSGTSTVITNQQSHSDVSSSVNPDLQMAGGTNNQQSHSDVSSSVNPDLQMVNNTGIQPKQQGNWINNFFKGFVDSLFSLFGISGSFGGASTSIGNFSGIGSSDSPSGTTNLISGTNDNVIKAIRDAADATGVDFGYLMAKAHQESGFRPNARAGTSGAKGLFQFIDSTRFEMIQKYGSFAQKYGLNRQDFGDPFNPRGSALMGALYAKENADRFKKRFHHRNPNATELYFMHFLGPGGGARFLTAYNQNKSAFGKDVLASDQVRANKSVFFDKSGRPYTVGQIYDRYNDQIGRRAFSYSEKYRNFNFDEDQIKQQLGGGLFGMPVGPNERITGKFGEPRSGGRPHRGIDFAGPRRGMIGWPIWATESGRVSHIGSLSGYGKTIIIDHGKGISSLYAHLNKYEVVNGQRVARGARIGEMGNTGLSSGPHLHFEIRDEKRRNKPHKFGQVDPSLFLSASRNQPPILDPNSSEVCITGDEQGGPDRITPAKYSSAIYNQSKADSYFNALTSPSDKYDTIVNESEELSKSSRVQPVVIVAPIGGGQQQQPAIQEPPKADTHHDTNKRNFANSLIDGLIEKFFKNTEAPRILMAHILGHSGVSVNSI